MRLETATVSVLTKNLKLLFRSERKMKVKKSVTITEGFQKQSSFDSNKRLRVDAVTEYTLDEGENWYDVAASIIEQDIDLLTPSHCEHALALFQLSYKEKKEVRSAMGIAECLAYLGQKQKTIYWAKTASKINTNDRKASSLCEFMLTTKEIKNSFFEYQHFDERTPPFENNKQAIKRLKDYWIKLPHQWKD